MRKGNEGKKIASEREREERDMQRGREGSVGVVYTSPSLFVIVPMDFLVGSAFARVMWPRMKEEG